MKVLPNPGRERTVPELAAHIPFRDELKVSLFPLAALENVIERQIHGMDSRSGQVLRHGFRRVTFICSDLQNFFRVLHNKKCKKGDGLQPRQRAILSPGYRQPDRWPGAAKQIKEIIEV